MMPYSPGLILDNANNYGIVKTETVFGFVPPNHTFVNDNYTSAEPVEWIFKPGSFEKRSLQETSRGHSTPKHKKTKKGQQSKKKKRHSKKVNKCVYKVVRQRQKTKRRNRFRFPKKMMMPLILGLLAAKSILVPVALKALAFMSVKGLMMGFFSTVMASILSLKGMFDNSHVQNRKDDSKTQVEIIQVPSKSEDHYYDEHYRRGDIPGDLISNFRK